MTRPPRTTEPPRDEPAPGHPPLTDRKRSATSFDPDASLTPAEARVEASLPRPWVEDTTGAPVAGEAIPPAARIFVRGPWEMLATGIITLGVFMLMQPFSIALYSWSFLTTLVGTVMFIVVSHFPERRNDG